MWAYFCETVLGGTQFKALCRQMLRWGVAFCKNDGGVLGGMQFEVLLVLVRLTAVCFAGCCLLRSSGGAVGALVCNRPLGFFSLFGIYAAVLLFVR